MSKPCFTGWLSLPPGNSRPNNFVWTARHPAKGAVDRRMPKALRVGERVLYKGFHPKDAKLNAGWNHGTIRSQSAAHCQLCRFGSATNSQSRSILKPATNKPAAICESPEQGHEFVYSKSSVSPANRSVMTSCTALKIRKGCAGNRGSCVELPHSN